MIFSWSWGQGFLLAMEAKKRSWSRVDLWACEMREFISMPDRNGKVMGLDESSGSICWGLWFCLYPRFICGIHYLRNQPISSPKAAQCLKSERRFNLFCSGDCITKTDYWGWKWRRSIVPVCEYLQQYGNGLFSRFRGFKGLRYG